MSLAAQVQGWVEEALEDFRAAIRKTVERLTGLDERITKLEEYVQAIEQSDGIPADPRPRAVSAPARGSAARKTTATAKSTTAQAGTAEARGQASP